MSQRQSNPLSDLEVEWYKRLRAEGFVDIERASPNRELMDWHSLSFIRQVETSDVEARIAYFDQLDDFLNHKDLDDIALIFVKHGNCLFDQQGIKQIWESHRIGWSERRIARHYGCSKTCVHHIIKRLRAWMALI